MKNKILHKQKSLRDQKQFLLQHLKDKERVLKEFSHERISEIIKKTRIKKHNQMLTDVLLHEFSDFRNHSDTFRIEKLSNHFNQKKIMI